MFSYFNLLLLFGAMVLVPGNRTAGINATDVESQVFSPTVAGNYSTSAGTIAVNSGTPASSVAYTVGDKLQCYLDAAATYSTATTATVTGDGGDNYSEVYTVMTIAEPVSSGDVTFGGEAVTFGGDSAVIF